MSLQVWLPLNGDLNNYGLSNYTLHTLPSGASWSAGKLGNNLNISNAGTTATINQISGLSTFSISFWYKFATGQTFTTYSDLINISMTSANKGNFRIEVSNNNGTTTNWYGHNLTDGGMGLYTTTPGVWYHDAIVVDGTNLKRYVNGTLVSEKTVNIAYTTSSFKLGDGGMYCQLADVRVYDHALSQKEVKEISKGLVCHYPLDNNGSGMPNLVNGSNTNSVDTNGFGYSEQTGGSTRTIEYDGGIPCVKITRNTTAHSGWDFFWYNKLRVSDIKENTTYTISFDAIASGSGTIGLSGFLHGNGTNSITQSVTTVSNSFNANGWSHIQFITTTKASFDGISVGGQVVYMSCAFLRTVSTWIKLKNIRVTEGSNESPWSPSVSDASYSIFNINSNKEIDISGYGNHGTKSGTITYNSDTPRYSTSTVFNGSNTFIACGRGGMVKDAITISLWAYQSSWSSFTRPISCTEGGGWNFEASGNYISFQCGTGTSSNTYKPVNSQKTYASLAAGWHMFTATYDGLASKIYIDGVLDNTATSYTTKTPIFYNSSNGIFIGAEAGGNQTTPAGTYFNGRISDVRIYATALTADDVKELYQVSASIDNKGNILGYDFQE